MTRFAVSMQVAMGLAVAAAFLPTFWRVLAWAWIATIHISLLGLGVAFIRMKWFGPAICSGPVGNGRVALTFDDGPDPVATTMLLDVLRKHGVKAIFFCVGQRVEQHPELTRRLMEEGHLIGNHSYHHGRWGNLFVGRWIVEEYQRAQDAIVRTIGHAPKFARPPVGITSPGLPQIATRLKLTTVGWSVRSLDRNAPAKRVIARVMRKVADGSIVVLHDGGVDAANLIEIVEGLIPALRERGLEPVRLDVLLEES